jgi:intein-encoded DNA endonuclease-like protein
LLEKIKDYICPEQDIIVNGNSIILKISSSLFCKNLINLGCVYEKTYKELEIPEMEESLLRHFIRGYFDGDGTVFYDRKYLKANIASINENFLIKLQTIINDYNIDTRINVEKRAGKVMRKPLSDEYSTSYKDMYRLFVSKKDSLEKFKKFLYDDSTIYLSRKKDVFYKDDIELTK